MCIYSAGTCAFNGDGECSILGNWVVHRLGMWEWVIQIFCIVLTSLIICLIFLTNFLQLQRNHRVIILHLMETVCKEHIHDIQDNLAKDLVTLATSELTHSQVNYMH